MIGLFLLFVVLVVLVWGVRQLLPLMGLGEPANRIIVVVLVVLLTLYLVSVVAGLAPGVSLYRRY